MRKFIELKTAGAGAAAALAMGLASASPAAAQAYGDPLIDAAVRAVLGVSTQDSRYYDRGTYRGPDCQYYRDGRCYRNLGHWEREHGINSRTDRYRYNNGYGAWVEGRTYAGRGYYRDGRFWRNHGQWRSYQNHRDRDYRYDRRW
ncbi:hypothetical protein BrevBR_06980 [Brevundimonas sp. BR2-1]|uniref:hypothetical protein n=1 Tax=Brevundimonas sp. BR2-1 TaxID=3031123 RepID=UPI0030A89DC5